MIPRKKLIYGKEVEKNILAGCEKVAKAVGSTHGPAGNNVIFQSDQLYPLTTKDGVTVARELYWLADDYEKLAAQMMVQASNKQLLDAGDGTTTTIVIANEIVKSGYKAIQAGTNSTLLRKGMNICKDLVVQELKKISRKADKLSVLEDVATISCNNNEELGKTIALAIDKVGEYGTVDHEKSREPGYYIDYKPGYHWKKGCGHWFFTDRQKNKAVHINPHILVTDRIIHEIRELLPLLTLIIKTGKETNNPRSLIIICDEIIREPKQSMIDNHMKGNFTSCIVHPDGLYQRKKDDLSDIAIKVGAKFISHERGTRLQDITLDDLGTCAKFVADNHTSSIMGGAGSQEDIEALMERLKYQIENEEDEAQVKHCQERLARLCGGVAVIKVGGKTEVEQIELDERVDDAVKATQAAKEEGIVPGAGLAFISVIEKVREIGAQYERNMQIGVDIILKAIESPIRNILNNASIEADEEVEKIKNCYSKSINDIGYNVFDRNIVDDTYKEGIIDPLKVVRTALENAVSVASLLLISKTMIKNESEVKK